MSAEITLFYAADIHGSDLCFKKWLNAGKAYGADVIVIGGDLTGKLLVPVYPMGGGWRATWHGRVVDLETDVEVAEFSRSVRAEGAYALVTDPEEVEEIRGSIEKEREVFLRLKRAALEEWVTWADERLAGTGVRALVMPGNDDPEGLDEVLDSSRTLENVQGRVVELADGIHVASRGESNPTPWHTPRELPDEELEMRFKEVIAETPETGVTIWNFHVPPYHSGIDEAPQLDDRLNVQYSSTGEPNMIPVGSRALERLIEQHQPTLGLHGHIHEGRGRYKRGRTVGFNPGSVYSEGTLLGVIVRVSSRRGVRAYAFTGG